MSDDKSMKVSGNPKDREKLIEMFKKNYGPDSIMTLDSKPKECEFIPTGILSLDSILGIGGIPRGKITEIYGPESSGKSSICLQIIANAQNQGLRTLYIDTEHAFNPTLAEMLGVDFSNLLFSQPDSGEDALQMVREGAESGLLDLIILDSVGVLSTKSELSGEIGDSNVGGIARMMSQAMRLIVPQASLHNVAVVFVNQVRMQIGVMFGNPQTTPGGKALGFAASVRIEMTPSTVIKEGEEIVGRTLKAKIIKNRLAPPFKNCSFDVIYSQNLVALNDLLNLATEANIVSKSGSWFSYGSIKIGQGKNNAVSWLQENKELQEEIIEKVRGFYGIPEPKVVNSSSDAKINN